MKGYKFAAVVTQVVASVFLIVGLGVYLVGPIWGAPFTKVILRFDRIKVATPSTLQVILIPVTVGTEAEVRISFGTGVTIGAGVSVTVTNLGLSAVALPGTTLVASGAGNSIVVTGVTDLTVGTTYGFNLTTGVSTPVGAGSVSSTVVTQTSAHATIDSSTVTSAFITDDQIVITGNVPPAFTFTITGNTDTFTADLGTTAVSTNGRAISVTTNANKGWVGWVKSANSALYSATTGVGESITSPGTIDGAPSTCSPGADCYVLDADLTTSGAGSGTLVIDAEYLGTGTSQGGTLSSSFQTFAARSGKTSGDVVTLYARAAVVSTKAAASDYTDTWTVVGAGSF